MSRTGFHNAYKEYRDVTLNGAVEQMYQVRAGPQAAGLAQVYQMWGADLAHPPRCQSSRPAPGCVARPSG